MKFKSFKNSFKSRSGQPSGKDDEEKGRRVNKGSLRSRVEEKKLLKKTPSTPPKLPSSIDYELLAIDVKEVCKEVKESLSELLLDFEEYEFYSNEIMGHCETLQDNAEKITVQLDGRQEDERVPMYENNPLGEGGDLPDSVETSKLGGVEVAGGAQIGVITEEVEPL